MGAKTKIAVAADLSGMLTAKECHADYALSQVRQKALNQSTNASGT